MLRLLKRWQPFRIAAANHDRLRSSTHHPQSISMPLVGFRRCHQAAARLDGIQGTRMDARVPCLDDGLKFRVWTGTT